MQLRWSPTQSAISSASNSTVVARNWRRLVLVVCTTIILNLVQTHTPFVTHVNGLKYDGVTITIASASPNIILNFEAMAPRFTNLTGLTINNYGLPKAQLVTNIADDLAKGSPYFDCFSSPMGWAIDWIIDGHIMKLTDRIKSDATKLQWLDISSFFRNNDASYQGDIWTFPMDGDVHYLYSRMDVLKKAGYNAPPTSWSDFMTIAAAVHGTDMNGDGLPDSAICVVQKPSTDAFYAANGLLAGYLQYQGTSQGFFFDPETMAPLSKTIGWKKAMELFKSFQTYGMPNMTQADVGGTRQVFLQQGACAFTIDWGDVFVQANATKYRDVIVASPVPGPDEVYDRVNDAMVKCSSDSKICPYATNNINGAPFAASGGWTSMISSHIPQIRQDACYDFISFMISPEQHNELVQSGNGYEMNRISQTNADFWHKAGWTGSQVDTSLTNFGNILASHNMAIDLNIPQNAKYFQHLDAALALYLSGQTDVDTFGQTVYDHWELITNEAPTGRSGQLDAYRGILGLQPLNRATPVYLSSAIYNLTLALSAIGFATVLFFGLSVIVFRDRPVMRASSPGFLLMMLVGASASFFAMPLLALDSATASVDVLNRVCPAQTYLFGIAFTLVFGSLAVRNWRIRKLFTDKLQVVVIRDIELIAKVGAILLVEMLYCAIWNGVDPLSHTVSTLGSDSTYERCSSNHTNIWLGIYLAPKALLLLFVLYLAYATRTIELGQFNESKELAFVSYNVAFVIIVALPLALALAGSGSVAAAALTRVLAVWFCMTLSLACIFVPKLIRLNDTSKQLMSVTGQSKGASTQLAATGGKRNSTHAEPATRTKASHGQHEASATPDGSRRSLPITAVPRLSFPNSTTGTKLPMGSSSASATVPERTFYFHFQLPVETPTNIVSSIIQTIQEKLGMGGGSGEGGAAASSQPSTQLKDLTINHDSINIEIHQPSDQVVVSPGSPSEPGHALSPMSPMSPVESPSRLDDSPAGSIGDGITNSSNPPSSVNIHLSE